MLEFWISFIPHAISFCGLMLVVVQLRRGTKQREAQSQLEIYGINRQLLTLGFSNPQLFAILDDADDADPVLERRYLQLWLNQLALIHSYAKQSTLRGEDKEALFRDFADVVTRKNFQRHWPRWRKYYPESLQETIDAMIKKEPPSLAALEDARGES